MAETSDWIEGFPAAITVTDASGIIVAMNARSQETFAADGGAALLGKDVHDCHPGPARAKLSELYRTQAPNHYTISKAGQRKIVHQVPWYRDGRFAGLVEIVIPIPEDLPHFARD